MAHNVQQLQKSAFKLLYRKVNILQVFDSSGKFMRSFGKEGRLEGELSEPRAIAFTPSHGTGEGGNLLVAEMENQRVSMFSDDGQYLCTYGDSCEVRTEALQGLRYCILRKSAIF